MVCVTTGILRQLDAEELEGVLAHELSHVAHRDVLVMTVASSAGIVAGMLTRGAQFGGSGCSAAAATTTAVPAVADRAPGQPRRLRHQLLPDAAALALPRAVRRPGGRLPHPKPSALASALQKITGEMAAIPQRDLRAAQAMNAFFIAPAISGASLQTLTSTHPSLEQRLEQLARIQAARPPEVIGPS